MRVEVYFNLHKKCLSVRGMEGEHKGRILAHVDSVALVSNEKFPVKFAVQESGRQRVLRDGQKNVHAFVRGEWVGNDLALDNPRLVTYNPYKYDSFVLKEDTSYRVHKAHRAVLNGKQILADIYEISKHRKFVQ